jgi:3-dehydroquinate dehydratase-1
MRDSPPFDTFALAASVSDLDREPDAREHADLVEFRMDLASEPLTALRAYDGDLPVLATNRVEREGGEAVADESRLDDLVRATRERAVVAVDVELSAVETGDGERVLSAAEEAGADTIVSVHDFERTPSREQLRKSLAAAADHGTVGKVAVTAADAEDVLDLLAATRERTRAGDRLATMAMGEPGRHSRAVAPLYGSRIGYAPLDTAEATAPGQFDVATLARVVETLRG